MDFIFSRPNDDSRYLWRAALNNSPPRTAVLTQSVKAVYEVESRTFVSTPNKAVAKVL